MLPLGKALSWEEYTLTLYARPGHTTYAVTIWLISDGKRVLAIGDQYAGGAKAHWNYVYNNSFALTDYAQSAALYRQLSPDLILSGNWEPYWTEPGYFDRLDERAQTVQALHHDLEFPRDWATPSWQPLYRLEPYQLEVGCGERFRIAMSVYNPLPEAQVVTVRPNLRCGWRAKPEEMQRTVAGNAAERFTFPICPVGAPGRRFRVGAEVYLGSRRREPQGEMLVTLT